MSPYLIAGVLLFCLAFVFYTWGVWAERISGRLKPAHIRLFFAGISVDVLATISTFIAVGGLVLTPHALFGFTALALMIVHSLWGAYVLFRKNEHWITHFHKFSLFVWSFWTLSFVSGMVLGMGKFG